jgi:phosphate:Na+ symporter
MTVFQYIVLILTIAGSLGLFLYGMKLMSESILKVAGARMRSTVTKITSDRWRGVATGIATTGIIQSSTAITVLTVGLVNAGVVSLPASISIIIGANIGTTVTGWLVAMIGFQLKMSVLSLVVVAFAIPLYLAGKRNLRNWAECMIGFALLFISLHLLRDSLPDLQHNPEVIAWLSSLSADFVHSEVLFLIAGTIITMVLQSSSAVMSLTLVMASGSLITFHDAAGMILGVNIGTTISANIAAFVANRDARIAARSHFIFNLIGAAWALPLLGVIITGIDVSLTSSGHSSPIIDAAAMPLALAIFHTFFNITNAMLLIGLIPWLRKISGWLVLKAPDLPKKQPQLTHMDTGLLSTSEIALVQARKVIKHMFNITSGSFSTIKMLLVEKDPDGYKQLIKKVKKNEKTSDQIELEINLFLAKIATGNLSFSATREIHKMVKIVDELETITDYCLSMSKAIDMKNQEKVWFSQELRDKLNLILHKAEQLIAITGAAFTGELPLPDAIISADDLELEIKMRRSVFRNEHLAAPTNQQEYSYQAGMAFMTLINSTEKVADHCMNILEALQDQQQSPF